MKVLAVVSEPIDADALRAALGDAEVTEDAEVLVVSPALHASGLRFWMSDDDDAIARAEAVQQETVERLEEAGIDAAGDTGEADPMTAIQDALQTFPAERIVIFSHPEGEQSYREEELDEAQRRFGVPVVQGSISA
jgi:nucleotide-binding universal stress UspA family protein